MSEEIQVEVDHMTIARQGGWARVPTCKHVLFGEDGKMYCSYYYEQARSELQERLGSRIFDDIGLNEVGSEDIRQEFLTECNTKECPSFSHKIGNKVSMAFNPEK